MENDSVLPPDVGEVWELAKKLKCEDPVQFHTLVRMHLSFVLDLNTDDCHSQPEKTKLRPIKWGFAPFTKKPKPLGKNNGDVPHLTQNEISQVYQLIEFLSKEDNVTQEGVFRRTGKLTRQQDLKSQLVNGVDIDLDEGLYSVHDCASVLKQYLAELQEPLLTEVYFPAYCQIAELCSNKPKDERLLQALQLLFLLLPIENWILLKDVLSLLQLVASHEARNKMSAENLATLFTPHLLCPRKLTPEALHSTSQTLSKVVAFMISNGKDVFKVPSALATDIQMYWERRKQSPDTCLNESTASAVTTVFSFVDRERTAQENVENPTEAALAQLYAHIQSLPESSKKRRLVKQFNKENGHGTPNHNRTKSLGDSIKKHIFNKTLKPARGFCEIGQLKKRSCSEEILTETMMTPRSRKPVVAVSASNICHLANLTWGIRDNSSDNTHSPLHYDSYAADGSLSDSLSGAFKDYLSGRSVLTASPVDLSFSSRTGDYDPSSDRGSEDFESSRVDKAPNSPLSESLLYILDGNLPNDLSSDSSGYGDGRTRKRDAEGCEDPPNKRIGLSITSKESSGLGTDSREAPHETSL